MDSLFLSEEFSDIKLEIIGSDRSAIIPAHKAILIQNSYYFKIKFNDLKMIPIGPNEALVVDVSKEGTLQEVLDVLQFFYLSSGKFISLQDDFAKLNSAILLKFLFKDREFIHFDIFNSIGKIEFSGKNRDSHSFNGLLNSNNFITCFFTRKEFNINYYFDVYKGYGGKSTIETEIDMKKYIDFTNYLKIYFDNNKIIYKLHKDAGAQEYIDHEHINISEINYITIPLYSDKNIKILFDDIKKKSDQKVKDIISENYLFSNN